MIFLINLLVRVLDWFDLCAKYAPSGAGSLGERASLFRRLTKNDDRPEVNRPRLPALLRARGAQVEFSTDHPSLLAKDSPHETRGILRMHRAGWTGARMSEILGIAQQSLKLQIKDALDEEGCAAAAKRPIYDARVPKGTR